MGMSWEVNSVKGGSNVILRIDVLELFLKPVHSPCLLSLYHPGHHYLLLGLQQESLKSSP